MLQWLVKEHQRQKFFIFGINDGMSPQEYGVMSVELSLPSARNLVDTILELRHNHDEASLLYQIAKNRGFAIANFLAMGAAAHVCYAAISLKIPEKIKPPIVAGVKTGMARVGGDRDALFSMFAAYLSAIGFDIQIGRPLRIAGTETHRVFMKNLAQGYSGRDDLEEWGGADSVTLAPFTDHYCLSIMTQLRETARLRFVG